MAVWCAGQCRAYTLGPVGALPSEEAEVMLYGPEPHHRAEAIWRSLGTGMLVCKFV